MQGPAPGGRVDHDHPDGSEKQSALALPGQLTVRLEGGEMDRGQAAPLRHSQSSTGS